MILHHAVWMEYVRANLVAPSDIRLFAADLRQLGLLLLDLPLVELRTKHIHRALAVLDLRAFRLASDDDPCRDMGDAHGRIGLVDMLTAGAAGTVRINLQVLRPDLDLDRVVDLRYDIAGYERRMPASRGIERRDPNESVHTLLGRRHCAP